MRNVNKMTRQATSKNENQSFTLRNYFRLVATILFVLVGFASVSVSSAAEIRIKNQSYPARQVVTLADVADVITADADEARQLKAIELFPAPTTRGREYLRAAELQDYLMLRGVDMSRCRFSGYGQVTINGLAPQAQGETPGDSVIRRAERKAADAIVDYLKRFVDAKIPWNVEVTLDAEQTLPIDRSRAIRISGGRSPWTGSQKFSLSVSTPQGIQTIDATAKVTTPQAVVVAARTLGRGQILGAASVELRVIDDRSVAGKSFSSIESVIGKELTTTVSVGRAITSSVVRSPIMVRRGDVVTVYSRCGGISVKTEGRARDAGGVGDLITVETIGRRETFHARVCGQRQVEIYAQGLTVDRSRPDASTAGYSSATGTGLTFYRKTQDSNHGTTAATSYKRPAASSGFSAAGIGSAVGDSGLVFSRK